MAKKEKNLVCNYVFNKWIKKKATAHAGVGVVNSNKEILLLKRASGDRIGNWELPSGFIDKDETPKKTAIRELKEETNITLIDSQLQEVGTFAAHHKERTDIITTFVAYQDDIVKEIILGKEHSDYCWVSLNSRNLRGLTMVNVTEEQIDKIYAFFKDCRWRDETTKDETTKIE